MRKELDITKKERIDNLAERVKAILVEGTFSSRMTILETRHQVGKEIIEDTLYEKGKKESGELIKEISKRIDRPKTEIYLCVKFYEKYPEVSDIVERLPGKKNDITWKNAIALIEGRKIDNHKHKVEKVECWQCTICGQLLRHKS